MRAGDPRRVSVVIPTRNRPDQLSTCLEALAKQTFPRDRFDVLVVEDGGDEPLDSIIQSFVDRLSVRLIRQSHTGPGRARNRGASAVTGGHLVFTDDDCVPTVDWLEKLAERIQLNPDHMIGGQVLNALPGNLFSTVSQRLITYLYVWFHGKPVHELRFFTTNNMAVPADRFREIGEFDSAHMLVAAEDRELCDRWLEWGFEMTYAPEVRVYHAHDLNLRRFLDQHFSYGRGAHDYYLVRARRGQSGLRFAGLRFYLGMVRYPFSETTTARAILEAALLLLSQGAGAAGYFRERLRPRSGSPGKLSAK